MFQSAIHKPNPFTEHRPHSTYLRTPPLLFTRLLSFPRQKSILSRTLMLLFGFIYLMTKVFYQERVNRCYGIRGFVRILLRYGSPRKQPFRNQTRKSHKTKKPNTHALQATYPTAIRRLIPKGCRVYDLHLY